MGVDQVGASGPLHCQPIHEQRQRWFHIPKRHGPYTVWLHGIHCAEAAPIGRPGVPRRFGGIRSLLASDGPYVWHQR